MSTITEKHHQQAQEMLEQAASRLEICLQHFLDDKEMPLKEFDHYAQAACTIIQAMPKEEAQLYKPDLETLSTALVVLSGRMEERFGELKQRLQGMDVHRLAHAAYKRNSGSSGE